MSNANSFRPTVLGLTAFVAANRIDFVLDGPEFTTPERCSAFYDNPDRELKLAGKKLTFSGFERDEDGEVILNAAGLPAKMLVRWDRRNFTLGQRSNASGPVSYYRSLETANDSASPRTAEQILGAVAGFMAASN